MSSLPIVVVAFKRVEHLSRLLKSLMNAQYPVASTVRLIISLDGGADDECIQLAREFDWKKGDKEVVVQEEHLGLKKHIAKCGELSKKYGAIVVLEDDLIVSRFFYSYACDALKHYGEDEQIASIALYSYRNNEFCKYPFEIIHDGWDAYFMRVPCSWGQIFIGRRWSEYETFIQEEGESLEGVFIPEAVSKAWTNRSWKKPFFKYLVKSNKYVVYPSFSYSDHFGDLGTHFKKKSLYLSSGLSQHPGPYRFPLLDQTVNRYDQFMELEIDRAFGEYRNCEMDLYGLKPLSLISKENILTSHKSNVSLSEVPLLLRPPQANVVAEKEDCTVEIKGNSLSLSKVKDVERKSNNHVLNRYYSERVSPKIANFYVNRGIGIQHNYFMSKWPVRMGIEMKRIFRKIIQIVTFQK